MGDLDITSKLKLDASGFQAGIDKAKGSGASLKSELTSAFSAVGLSGVASFLTIGGAVTAFTGLLVDCTLKSDEGREVFNRLAMTLESTGRSSEISAGQLDQSAQALARMSSFDDEAVNQMYMAIAQFENVPSSRMEDLAAAAMDMTAALGGDLAGNASQLAAILDTGVIPRTMKFTAALRDQIQEAVKAGDTNKALNLLLGELGTKYGGQAELALEHISGATKRLQNDFENLQERMGSRTSGPWVELVNGLDSALISFTQLSDMADMFLTQGGGGASLWENIFPPLAFVHNVVDGVKGYKDVMDGTADVLYKQDAATKSLTGSMGDLGGKTKDLTVDQKALADATRENTSTLSDLEGAATRTGKDYVTSMKEMAVESYKASLAADGLFSEEDISRVLQFEKALGIMTEQEYQAALKAWALSTALDNLPRNTSLTVWLNTVLTGAGAGGYLGELPSSGGGGGDGGGGGGVDAAKAAKRAAWLRNHPGKTEADAIAAGYARGGQLGDGWAAVGEEGWELIDPFGHVFPHDVSEQMARFLGGAAHFAEGSFAPRPPLSAPGGISTGGSPWRPPPMPGKPKDGGGGGGGGAAPNPLSSPTTAPDAAAAAATSQAAAASSAARSAATSVARSASEMAAAASRTAEGLDDLIEETRGLRRDIAELQETTISEINKAMT